MRFTEVVTRLESMASAFRNGLHPMISEGNIEALTKAVDMLEGAAEQALLSPDCEVRVEVVSTSTFATSPSFCTRKHNCHASPEPCNGFQRPKVVTTLDEAALRDLSLL